MRREARGGRREPNTEYRISGNSGQGKEMFFT